MDEYNYIERALCYCRQNDREKQYTCHYCKKDFTVDEFAVLPALEGYLTCEKCYREQSKEVFKDKPYAGGYLVNLIDEYGINRYAFSHGGRASLRAVAYNEYMGYFLVKQEMCDLGEGYCIAKLPTYVDFNNISEVAEYEKNCQYSDLIYGLFHPIFYYIQFKGEIQPDNIIIKKLKERNI